MGYIKVHEGECRGEGGDDTGSCNEPQVLFFSTYYKFYRTTTTTYTGHDSKA